jgi:glycosyltransferase involved in cell wall biosynthesis
MTPLSHTTDERDGRIAMLLSIHSAQRAGAELMGLRQAQDLAQSFALTISIPDGPLRAQFSSLGELVAGPPPLPIWTRSPRLWARRSVLALMHAVRLAALIRRRNIRIVVVNSATSLAPVLAGRLAGARVIVHGRELASSRRTQALFALQARLADRIVAVSDSAARAFSPHARARVTTIHDGVEHLGEGPARHAAFERPVRVCVVGAIDPGKGQDVALDALRRLRERGRDIQLTMVGRVASAPFYDDLRRRVNVDRLVDQVRFAGTTEDVFAALELADICLVPSRIDAFPATVLEGLVSGTPLVASNVGGIPEVVEDGVHGLLVPPGDADALAGAIDSLIEDPEAARAMAERGRSHVIDHFDLKLTLAGYRSEIERVLEQPAPA